MIDFIIAAIIILLLGCAMRYLYKQKKRGKGCVGCPYCGGCSKKKCDK